MLFRNAFGTQRPGGPLRNAFDMRLKNPANTNAVLWGGRLLALWEVGTVFPLPPSGSQALCNPHNSRLSNHDTVSAIWRARQSTLLPCVC